MNSPSFRIFCQALLVAVLHGLGHTATFEQPEHVARTHVLCANPQKFTHQRRAEFKPNSEASVDATAKFMQEMEEETIPRDMNLDIRVTDVDLAGNFEPWRRRQSEQVRIPNQLYPPRV